MGLKCNIYHPIRYIGEKEAIRDTVRVFRMADAYIKDKGLLKYVSDAKLTHALGNKDAHQCKIIVKNIVSK